ncbi:hypothetical protein K0M31_002597 [Melipona bicolor]|uniref:Uncharacterized protein n=1 Tax=Melipona bicolor TaxID=60889 RepID=A0AA40GI53_9HYME|nr:hypothetical protein K0M31_002597 [Melipona bicolor]
MQPVESVGIGRDSCTSNRNEMPLERFGTRASPPLAIRQQREKKELNLQLAEELSKRAAVPCLAPVTSSAATDPPDPRWRSLMCSPGKIG